MVMGLSSFDLGETMLLKGEVLDNPLPVGDPLVPESHWKGVTKGDGCWIGPRGGGINSAGDLAYSGLNS